MYKIFNLLKILNKQTTTTVRLFYSNYRSIFNMHEVPMVSCEYDKHGDPMFVTIDRLKAIEFLKQEHNFVKAKELDKKIKEEFNGTRDPLV